MTEPPFSCSLVDPAGDFFVSGGGQPGPLHLRRAIVVSTSEAGTDDAGNVTSCMVEVRISGHNAHTTRLFSAVRKVANMAISVRI